MGVEEANQDPIDMGFLRAAAERGLAANGTTITFIPFSPETRRTEAVVSVGGRTVRTMKGALRTMSEASGLGPDAIAGLEARANEETRKGARVPRSVPVTWWQAPMVSLKCFPKTSSCS